MQGWLERWLNLMAEYEYEISRLAGDKNFISNYLSQSTGARTGKGEKRDIQIDKFFTNNGSWDSCLVPVTQERTPNYGFQTASREKTLRKSRDI